LPASYREGVNWRMKSKTYKWLSVAIAAVLLIAFAIRADGKRRAARELEQKREDLRVELEESQEILGDSIGEMDPEFARDRAQAEFEDSMRKVEEGIEQKQQELKELYPANGQ
jgi:hypothetical protein